MRLMARLQGNEFLINSYTSNNQYDPSVTALADGGFVVTWRGGDQDGSGYGVSTASVMRPTARPAYGSEFQSQHPYHKR